MDFNINKKLARDFLEAFEPTEMDIQRQMKPCELKELCLRLKCRVNMTDWNPVYDAKKRFISEGRLLNKSERGINRLLAKCVNINKEYALYTDDEIQTARNKLWRYRKKENLMRLDVWEYDREKERAKVAQQQQEQEKENSQPTNASENFVFVVPTTQNVEKINDAVNDFFQKNTECITIKSTTQNVEKVDEAVIDFFQINTESMTVNSTENSQMFIETQSQSQPVYDEFSMDLPLSSTQGLDLLYN